MNDVSLKKVYSIVGLISFVVVGFLVWLIYLKPETATTFDYSFLPLLNSIFNGISFICVVTGIYYIKKGEKEKHIRMMFSALLSSTFFFISYVIYHTFVGDVKYTGEGFIRYIYFFILITHIVLSVVVVPIILTTFYFGLNKLYTKHKKLGKYTFAVWAYVSLTGVVIYLMNQA